MKGLEGKTAIVSGGATLIGESCAAVLAGYGVNVVIADINEADGSSVADAHRRQGELHSATDITSDDDIAALVAATVEAARPPRLPGQRRLHLSRQRRGDRARRLAEGVRRQRRRLGDADAGGAPASCQEDEGRHRQFRLDLGARRAGRALGLSGLQGGDPAADAQPGARSRAGRHPGQRGVAGLDLEQHHEAADATTTAPRPTRSPRPSICWAAPAILRRSPRRSRSCCRMRRASSPAPTSGSTAATRRSAPSGSIRQSRC